jgi:hypothetical protein
MLSFVLSTDCFQPLTGLVLAAGFSEQTAPFVPQRSSREIHHLLATRVLGFRREHQSLSPMFF